MFQIFLVEQGLEHFALYGQLFLAVVEVRDVLPSPQPAQDGGKSDVDDVTGGVKDMREPCLLLRGVAIVSANFTNYANFS